MQGVVISMLGRLQDFPLASGPLKLVYPQPDSGPQVGGNFLRAHATAFHVSLARVAPEKVLGATGAFITF